MVSAILAFPVAKLIDAFGRAEGFAFVALCSTLGSILSAACTGIDSYFGARVFKTIGNTGSDYVATVIISDMTALISRPFYLGLTALPYLATGFAGPAIAERLLQVSSWRWGYGIFSITTPVVSSFLLYFLFAKQRETQKFQVAAESPVPKGIKKQVLYWFWEFDVIGLTLVAAGFVLLLLAVTLAKYNGSTWRSGHIIAMLVLGPLCILAFLLWERSPLNPKLMIPFHLLLDRTVLGVCTMGAVTRIAYYLWANYFPSYLQVVHGLSVTRASYVDNVYSYVTCAWAPLLGLLFRHCCPHPKRVALAAPSPSTWPARLC
ncbi:Siderophore iron transporter 1 [Lasiodiplodia theobromae]|uniref:Siderophore iron transporter 1 n=1 Tax=Lasiodiplodia theobromae TaxID=45133 RepID=A0A5N5DAA1_9PEZI|nr:Siderophore iron transporter 1 [Lasiodiplodia theobromae]